MATTKKTPAKGKSQLEETFALHCKAFGVAVEREFKFHPDRKWRFDFAIPVRMIAVEIEGGIWTGGRHSRGVGMIADMEKYNEAQRLGWSIFRFDGDSVKSGEAIRFVERVLTQRDKENAV